jgi:hypothetical protein
MTLDAVEFLRRFFLHLLPKGFVRIRHYGLLAIVCATGSCRWHASCSQPIATSNSLSPRRRNATSALSPVWKSHACRRALHRRPVIPGEVRFLMTASANPRYRLALRTSAQKPATTLQNRFTTTFNGIPKPADRRSPLNPLIDFQHHRRRNCSPKSLTELPDTIQYP